MSEKKESKEKGEVQQTREQVIDTLVVRLTELIQDYCISTSLSLADMAEFIVAIYNTKEKLLKDEAVKP